MNAETIEKEYTFAGTAYPSEHSWPIIKNRLQQYANERNNGKLGPKIRYYSNDRGVESFYFPDIKAYYTENYS